MSKWNAVRNTFERAHEDLFEPNYTATFFNYSSGSYNPDTGEMENRTRSQVGSENVEIVPPGIDSTVDSSGTSFSWDTSIRFPLGIDTDNGWGTNYGHNWGSVNLVESLTPLGVDTEKPTEIELTDETDNSTDVYELHGYTVENGSGMVMCRIVEQ